jgi:hypothetical protein
MSETAKLLQFDIWLATETCFKCGIIFGMPNDVMRNHRQKGTDFWCPNGHQQHYTESEVQRLQKQLDAQKRDTEWQRGRANTAEKSLIAQKGITTKLRKRIANGVCPCCQRSFTNVAQHMKRKHPDYAANE